MKPILMIAILIFSSNLSWAKTCVLTDDEPDGIALYRYLEYYEDKEKTITLDDFMNMKELSTIKGLLKEDSNYWFRFTILNKSKSKSLFLVIRSPAIDYIDFYYHNPNGNGLVEYHTGDRLPFDYRPVKFDHNFTFPFELKKGHNVLYFKLQSTSPIRVPLYIYSEQNYLTQHSSSSFIVGILIGFTFLLWAFFAILALYSKKTILISLFLSICCELYYLLQTHGLAFKYFWNKHPLIDDYSVLPTLLIGSTLTLIVVNCFPVNQHQSLKNIWKRFIKTVIIFNFICGILIFILDFRTAKTIIYSTFSFTYLIGCIFLMRLFGLRKPYFLATTGYYLALFAILSETTIHFLTIYINSDFYLVNHIPSSISVMAIMCWGLGVVNATSLHLKDQDDSVNNLKIAIKKSEEIEEKFVTALCHELGTPIQTAEYALDKLYRYAKNEDIKKIADRLELSIKKLSFLTKNFIKKAQSKNYQVVLKFEKVNINHLINNVIASLSTFISEYRHEVIFANSKEEEHTAEIDKNLIEQALSNIILNAIKYTPSFGKIIINLKKLSNNLLIRVIDNGYGIQTENPKNIFMAFYRSDLLKDSAGGLGIGLSISQKIIEDHNGSITYVSPLPKEYSFIGNISEKRVGTVFIIYLPLKQNKGEKIEQ
ncbi:MAG: sensor histidine kinase [Proteobacteria bacterium]|nr:sensor histidine kinase [Pseudomonadota bacterium]